LKTKQQERQFHLPSKKSCVIFSMVSDLLIPLSAC
jgi:hypothetical protein